MDQGERNVKEQQHEEGEGERESAQVNTLVLRRPLDVSRKVSQRSRRKVRSMLCSQFSPCAHRHYMEPILSYVDLQYFSLSWCGYEDVTVVQD